MALSVSTLSMHVRLLVATFWVGSIWTVGYLVAPTVFATLNDRLLAGTIAGSVFKTEAWVSIACTLLLLALIRWSELPPLQRRTCLLLVALMGACTVIGYFGLQPMMASLREAAGASGMEGEARSRFGMLHGASSAFYLLQSLLGLVLITRIR